MTRRPRPATTLAAVVAVLAGTLGLAGALGAMLRRGYYRVEVAGRSMDPALQPGDYLVLRRGAPAAGADAFGRVVALRDPEDRLLLKRVIGLPGEALRVGSAVQVNGRVLIEPYAHGTTPTAQFRGLNQLHDDEYFLLGDRRDASTDSRDFGPVPRARIEGVAVARYWPPGRVGRIARPARELGGAVSAGGEAPPGILGAGRALTASPRRAPEAEPRANGPDADDADASTGAEGGRSGEA